jgi:Disulphide bond corrector protein DsbC
MKWLAVVVALVSATAGGAQPRGALIGGGVKHFTVATQKFDQRASIQRATNQRASNQGSGARRAGDVTLIVTLTIDPGWHISWRNPGETGLPTRFAWRLPPGVRIVEERWPVPLVEHTAVGATHTLVGAVPWLVTFRSDSSVTNDRLIGLTVNAGVCKDVCIPEQVITSVVLPGQSSTEVFRPIPASLISRISARGGLLAARRVTQTELCVERLPAVFGGGLPEFVADSGTGLDAALPIRAGSGARRGAGLITVARDGMLQQGAFVLFVRGAIGVAAQLDFRARAPRCSSR